MKYCPTCKLEKKFKSNEKWRMHCIDCSRILSKNKRTKTESEEFQCDKQQAQYEIQLAGCEMQLTELQTFIAGVLDATDC